MVGLFALAKQRFAHRDGALGHERLEPVERHVAFAGRLDLLDQLEHLMQPVDVERKQYRMQNDRRDAAEQRAVGDESNVANDPDDTKRNHGPHRERRNDEPGRQKTDHSDETHVPPKCLKSPAKGSQRLPGRQRSFSIETDARLRAQRKCQARASKVSSPVGSRRGALFRSCRSLLISR